MTKIIFYLTTFLLLLVSQLKAQESFESKVKAIAFKIENVTKEEKEKLKVEVDEVNILLEKGLLNPEQATAKKQALAQVKANVIESKVNALYDELQSIVKDKTDKSVDLINNEHDEKSYKFKLYYGKDEIKENVRRKDSIRLNKSVKRNTTEFVLAAGFSNLVTNNQIGHSDYSYLRSGFFEWGLMVNHRLLKDTNLLHLKYGITGVYNELHPTENRYFVNEGKQTNLKSYPVNLKDNKSYFRNVYVTIPVFLEFDLSKKQGKNGLPFFKSNQGLRFGIGSFVGVQTNSKQFLAYEENGLDIKEKQKGDFNTNNFIYGLSTYVGYKSTSLYLKYDLNPLFKDNLVKQNTVSLGLRFDFN